MSVKTTRPDVSIVSSLDWISIALSVILSEAKDLMPVASGDEILRCAQDDKRRRIDGILPPNDARNLMTGTRDGAIGRAEKYFDEGGFLAELQRRGADPPPHQRTDSLAPPATNSLR